MTALRTYLDQLCIELAAEPTPGRIPELARLAGADDGQLALAFCTVDGEVTAAGAQQAFAIQSISKAFAYGAAIDLHGHDYVTEHVDEEPTGEVFNAISLDPVTGAPKNPLVNVGAIRIHAMLGVEQSERTQRLLAALEGAAGHPLAVHEPTMLAELESADRNLALAHMLRAAGSMDEEPREVVEGYSVGCSVLVTVEDLAVMAATLASGGVCPRTGERVFSQVAARQVLSVMLTCGMYDDAGDWVSDVGLPAKSGVGGGIIAALPARFGIAAYAPDLDPHGNSVRGTRAFHRLSNDFALHMLSGREAYDLEERAAALTGD